MEGRSGGGPGSEAGGDWEEVERAGLGMESGRAEGSVSRMFRGNVGRGGRGGMFDHGAALQCLSTCAGLVRLLRTSRMTSSC